MVSGYYRRRNNKEGFHVENFKALFVSEKFKMGKMQIGISFLIAILDTEIPKF